MSESKRFSYTGPRNDVGRWVPSDAMTILDAGCSNGALGKSLKDAKPGRVVYGLEYDASFAAEAAERLDVVKLVDLNAFEWDLEIGASSVDCIIMADVLEHLLNPWSVLSDASSCLRSGGTVIVCLPNIRHITAFHSVFLRGTFPRRDRGIFDRTHLRWFTRRDALSMIEGAGLQVVRTVPKLRLFDIPGGRANTFLERTNSPLLTGRVVSEFLAYQYIFVCRKS